MVVAAALSQGFGYGIILGLGAAFGKQFYILSRGKLGANDGVSSDRHDLHHMGSQTL